MGGVIVPVLQTTLPHRNRPLCRRWIALSSAKGKGNITKFVAGVKACLAKNDIAGAQALCSKQKGSVAAVVSAALIRYEEMDKNTILSKEQKIATLQKEVEEATALEMPALQQNLPIVATMTTLGTLVGLLGTVIGMIKSFQALAQSGAPDSTELSTGISGGSYQHRLRYRHRCFRRNLLQLLHQQDRQPDLRYRRDRFLYRADICSNPLIPCYTLIKLQHLNL